MKEMNKLSVNLFKTFNNILFQTYYNDLSKLTDKIKQETIFLLKKNFNDDLFEVYEISKLRILKPTLIHNKLARSLLVDYGEFGCHLPDADLVIFDKIFIKGKIIIKFLITDDDVQEIEWIKKFKECPLTREIEVWLIVFDKQILNKCNAKCKKLFDYSDKIYSLFKINKISNQKLRHPQYLLQDIKGQIFN